MPVIATTEGWVRVKNKPTGGRRVDPAEYLRGPLSYFACVPKPQPIIPVPRQLLLPAPPLPKAVKAKQKRIASEPHTHHRSRHEEKVEVVEYLSDEDSRLSRSHSPPRKSKHRNHSHSRSYNRDRDHTVMTQSTRSSRYHYDDQRPSHSSRYYGYEHRHPPSSGRALSYSWHSAVQPLNL